MYFTRDRYAKLIRNIVIENVAKELDELRNAINQYDEDHKDNPDAGVLYLAHGLNNVINQMKCFDDTSETRVMLFMNMLCLISTQIQTFLPYHIPKSKFIF
ncbi:unnamed protein product [Rotaria sp. Silwood1]|nr:unnamed protein product [Rotaria sp. Silwood1]